MKFHNLEPDWGWADKFVPKDEVKSDLPIVNPGPKGDKLFFSRPGGYYDVYDTGLHKPPLYPGLPRVDGGIGSHPPHPMMPGHACGIIKLGPHY